MDELNRYIGEIDVRKLDSLLKMAIHISTAQVRVLLLPERVIVASSTERKVAER